MLVNGILNSEAFSISLVLGATFILSAALRSLLQSFRHPKYPLLGAEHGDRGKREQAFLHNAGKLYETAYRSLKTLGRVSTPDGEHLVIPNSYLDELKARGDDEIDVTLAFEKTMENDHLEAFPDRIHNTILNNSVKKDFVGKNLARINARISKEISHALPQSLPQSLPPPSSTDDDQWTPVVIYDAMLRVVSVASGSAFLGPGLCRDETYLATAAACARDAMGAVRALKRWPSWLRGPAVRLGLEPAAARFRSHRPKMRAFLGPVYEERKRLMERGDPLPDDAFQWMMSRADAEGVMDVDSLSHMLLILALAAIHATVHMVTELFYDIAFHNEIVEDLRREIRSAVSDANGEMTTQALFQMKLLDSVMRESQRMHPPNVDSFRRMTLKPITLKDGTQIPAGAYIETANTPVLYDPSLYPEPETFNPYRFFDLRTKPDQPDPQRRATREQYQFVSVNKENMSFGFGRHACPGRFFACNEIKLIVAQLLLEYDVKMPDGVEERYPSWTAGVIAGPDPSKTIMLRKIRE